MTSTASTDKTMRIGRRSPSMRAPSSALEGKPSRRARRFPLEAEIEAAISRATRELPAALKMRLEDRRLAAEHLGAEPGGGARHRDSGACARQLVRRDVWVTIYVAIELEGRHRREERGGRLDRPGRPADGVRRDFAAALGIHPGTLDEYLRPRPGRRPTMLGIDGLIALVAPGSGLTCEAVANWIADRLGRMLGDARPDEGERRDVPAVLAEAADVSAAAHGLGSLVADIAGLDADLADGRLDHPASAETIDRIEERSAVLRRELEELDGTVDAAKLAGDDTETIGGAA